MKLYTYYRSSASYRVRIALALKGISYEAVVVHLPRGDHLTDDFRAVNPQARVPALELDDGRLLIQSLAIIEYLDELHPNPPLLPKDPVDRARARAIAQIIGCDIHPFNNGSTRRLLQKRFHADDQALDSWAEHWLHEGFAAVERLIAPGPYAFGDRLTLADVCIVPQVFNARRFQIPLDAFPKTVGVDAEAVKHPAFARAAPGEQPEAD